MPASRVSAPRLAQLTSEHLLSRAGETVTTSFPVIGAETTALLQARALDVENSLRPALIDHISAIAACLSAQGFADSLRAIVLGYVLDGMTWDMVRLRTSLPDTRLSAERPNWNGLFWARYPKAESSVGTNELRGRGASLVMVWEEANQVVLANIANSSTTRRIMESIPMGARSIDLAGGEVPIINAVPDPKLQTACQGLAGSIAEAMLGQADLVEPLAQLGFSSRLLSSSWFLATN